ncbi:Rho guanine nucleotide exchange factor, putative [Hondaea fermentalgiana]|uniref:Rho guanine nucleotide exchange factor, putative n=1 Tax=Hondaea fermentalgiana TaxID=2315210 RepID=A0A2R5G9J6_9STRA|nr:Rho guanine nucleotide exchange factor, putative [Hondaea fermentalgiana]|eukprot:GBG24741.1 Rho guanine nucleotide exchange factor, putative [Hondaea fermentalgiana]
MNRQGNQVEARDYLTGPQMGRLLPLVPTILALLRELDPQAADLILEGDETDRTVVNSLMSSVLDNLNLHGDLTLREMRTFFAGYTAGTWINMVRIILTECWPRVVPDRVASEVLSALTSVSEASEPVAVAHILGPMLDRIPRMRFRVLAEFCAFVRDTSCSATDIACLVGPFLLLPARFATTDGTSLIASQTSASAAIMDMLIQETEIIFGRVAAPVSEHPLGFRPKEGKGERLRRSLRNGLNRLSLRGSPSTPPPPGLGSPSQMATMPVTPPRPSRKGRGSNRPSPLMEKRMKQLRVFYQWRDPRRVSRVELLFENYPFEEIALAIQRKYFMLPPKWSDQLEYMLLTGNSELGWFARLKEGILPEPLEHEVHITLSNPEGGEEQPQTKVDRVVNEIADTEVTFNKSLNDLLTLYVNRIKLIAEDPGAQKNLGLTADHIEHIFGARLERVADVSSNLLSDLEVVTLVRVQPKTGVSRIELVSRVFVEIAQQLDVFAPYAVNHSTAMNLLREARLSVSDAPGNSRPLRRMGSLLQSGDRNKNFLEIWQEVSSQSETLRGQTLESILIMPIQRVPRYKLLLEELIKATAADDPCHIMLEESAENVRAVADTINEAIRKHERVMKLVGEDPNLPASFRNHKMR